MTDIKAFKSKRKDPAPVKKSYRLWTLVVVMSTVLVLLLILLTVLTLQAYSVRSPIILRNPFVIKTNSPKPSKTLIKPTPVVTAVPSSHTYQYEDIINKIAVLESGNGTAPQGHHRACEERGQINVWGYGNGQGLCFDDRDAALNTLSIWITKRFEEGLDLETLVCYYNTGVKQKGCPYYKAYLTL